MKNKFTTGLGCTGCLLPIAAVIVFFLEFSNAGIYALIPAGLVAGAGIVLFTTSMQMENRRKKKQRERLFAYVQHGTNFSKLPSVASSDLLTRIAVDFRGKRLYIWSAIDAAGQQVTEPYYGMDYRLYDYAFEDIEAAALIENRKNEALTAAFSTLPMERYIRTDITESKKIGIREEDNGRVQLLALIVQADDITAPFHQVNFYYETALSITKDSAEYEEARGSLQKWLNYMDELLAETFPGEVKRIAIEERGPAPEASQPEPFSPEQLQLDQKTGGTEAAEAELLDKQPDEQPPPPESKPVLPPSGNAPAGKPPESAQPKELSYFEKIVAENKRMMDAPPGDRDEQDRT